MNFLPTRGRVSAGLILGLAITGLMVVERAFSAKATAELKVGSLPVGKILFLGNSITLHGPAPKIGWTGNWGMAASTPDKDYVHLLVDRVAKASGGTPKTMVRNVADFERKLTDFPLQDAFKEELAFEADVIILAIGENSASPKTDEDRKRFLDALNNLLTRLKSQGHPRIFVRSEFWADAEKDRLLKRASDNADAIYVDLSKLGADPSNAASSERKIEHAGVAAHPGDKGMAAIAGALWKAMKEAGGARE